MRSPSDLWQVRAIYGVATSVLVVILATEPGLSTPTRVIAALPFLLLAAVTENRMRRVGVDIDEDLITARRFLSSVTVPTTDITEAVLAFKFGRSTVHLKTRAGTALELPGFVQGRRLVWRGGETNDALGEVRRALGGE